MASWWASCSESPPGRQQLDRLADAARLVNRALLADRQVHGQVQERVGVAAFHVVHLFQRSVCVHEVGVVFGVLVNPLACYGFYSFKRLTGARLGINGAEKTANIGL